jgi:hypothetical protein
MTSAINPNNIDGTYPVAGQDNNSQGFRDNFTNTKTNFQFAADEISDLQNNAVLKAALAGTVLDNNMNDQLIYAANIRDFSATRLAIGTVSGNQSINYASGHFQTLTTSGSVNLSFANWPSAGTAGVVSVSVTVSSVAHTLTLTSLGTWVNATGIQGLNLSAATTAVITFAATGTYTFTFTTSDGGSTIFVSQTNEVLTPFNNSSEDLAASAAANLALTTSYFSTAAAETATLAAGVAGQIKTFAMFADSGDMVITVANAGWKTSGTGTITFDTIGDACTLQYINSKWFCIGNNGCVFA